MENEVDNRNCGCSMNSNMNCNYMPQGINAAFGYNTTSISGESLNYTCENNVNGCMKNRREIRQDMMSKIKSLNFAITDISEYLDTHPNDKKAICLHREYTNELNELEDKYQRIFGPLTMHFPCNRWRWIEEPWPWERSDFNVDL